MSCAADCNGKQNGKPSNRFCCGAGGGQNPVDCSDSRCTQGSFSCTSVPQPPGSFCCGTGGCEVGESCGTCSLDCTLGAEICTGGVDEDCDLAIDCLDSDCLLDPACEIPECALKNESCSLDEDCCSGICKANGRCR